MRRHIKKALRSPVVKLDDFHSLTGIKFPAVFMVVKFLVILYYNIKGILGLYLMMESLDFRMIPHMVEELLE